MDLYEKVEGTLAHRTGESLLWSLLRARRSRALFAVSIFPPDQGHSELITARALSEMADVVEDVSVIVDCGSDATISTIIPSKYASCGKPVRSSGVALTALGWLWWRPWPPLVAVAPRLFSVASVALGDICLRFVWQAWHLATSAFVLCGRRGTYGTGLALGWLWWRPWPPLVAVAPRLFCGASVALNDICLRFVWQAWHLATFAFVLCGRRGTYGTGLALVAALAAASFAWQAWHLVTSAFVLCGTRGTYGTGLALVVALVAAGRCGAARGT
eukprot:s832_g26.t1